MLYFHQVDTWGEQKIGLAAYLILLTLNYEWYDEGPGYTTTGVIGMLADIRADALADGRSAEYEKVHPDGRVHGLLLGMESQGLVRRAGGRWQIAKVRASEL